MNHSKKWIIEWNVSYNIHDGEGGLDEYLIVLPSFRRLVWWLMRHGRKCCYIYIWTSGRKGDGQYGNG